MDWLEDILTQITENSKNFVISLKENDPAKEVDRLQQGLGYTKHTVYVTRFYFTKRLVLATI